MYFLSGLHNLFPIFHWYLKRCLFVDRKMRFLLTGANFECKISNQLQNPGNSVFLLFAPVLCNSHYYLYPINREKTIGKALWECRGPEDSAVAKGKSKINRKTLLEVVKETLLFLVSNSLFLNHLQQHWKHLVSHSQRFLHVTYTC
jgi:hypothetical protein